MYSRDYRRIALALDVNVRTVQRALFHIRKRPILRDCVYPVRISIMEEIKRDYQDRQDALDPQSDL